METKMDLDDYVMDEKTFIGTLGETVTKPLEVGIAACNLMITKADSMVATIEKTSDLEIKKKQAKLGTQLGYALNGLEKLGYSMNFETNKVSKIAAKKTTA